MADTFEAEGVIGGALGANASAGVVEAVYSTVEDVLVFTGIKPVDFDFEDDLGTGSGVRTAEDKLAVMVTTWLVEIKDFIDHNRNRNYSQEAADGLISKVPPGINGIAKRAAGNMASVALLRRESSIQRVDILTRLKGDEVFSRALLNDLAKYPAKPRFRMSVSKRTNADEFDILDNPTTGYYL